MDRQSIEHVKGHISKATLDLADIGAIYARVTGQYLLRLTTIRAKAS